MGGNGVAMRGNVVSEAANDVFIGANDVSVRENVVSMGENRVSEAGNGCFIDSLSLFAFEPDVERRQGFIFTASLLDHI